MGVEDQLSAQEMQLRQVKESAEERDRMYEEVLTPNPSPPPLITPLTTPPMSPYALKDLPLNPQVSPVEYDTLQISNSPF